MSKLYDFESEFVLPEGTFRDGHEPVQGWMVIQYWFTEGGLPHVLPFSGAFPNGAAATAWVKHLENAWYLPMLAFRVLRLEAGEWETLYTWEKDGEFNAFA